MSDRISRIFINSNYKTNILDNHGDFGIDLPLGVIIEAGSLIQIAGFVVSHVWPTLDLQNSHLFVRRCSRGPPIIESSSSQRGTTTLLR